MNRKISKITAMVLFIAAALLFIYALWSLKYSMEYINMGISQGQIVLAGNAFGIVAYFTQNVFMYIIYALMLFGMGCVVENTSRAMVETVAITEQAVTVEIPTTKVSPLTKTKITPNKKRSAMKQANRY